MGIFYIKQSKRVPSCFKSLLKTLRLPQIYRRSMPVVISQGTSDSKEFMDLRADRAVVYSRQLADEDVDERAPYTPPMMGLSGGGDKITGVYLEGDVIIARGERRITGESAYYDFVVCIT